MVTLAPARRADLVPDGCPLSTGEFRTLKLLARGLTYKQIAHSTNRSPSTIRTHLHQAYRRLGVVDRAQAVIVGFRAGWLAPDIEPSTPSLDVEPSTLSYCQQRYNEAVDRYGRTRSAGDDYAMGVWCDAMFLEKGLAPPSFKRRGDRPVNDWLDHLRDERRIT